VHEPNSEPPCRFEVPYRCFCQWRQNRTYSHLGIMRMEHGSVCDWNVAMF